MFPEIVCWIALVTLMPTGSPLTADGPWFCTKVFQTRKASRSNPSTRNLTRSHHAIGLRVSRFSTGWLNLGSPAGLISGGDSSRTTPVSGSVLMSALLHGIGSGDLVDGGLVLLVALGLALDHQQ